LFEINCSRPGRFKAEMFILRDFRQNIVPAQLVLATGTAILPGAIGQLKKLANITKM